MRSTTDVRARAFARYAIVLCILLQTCNVLCTKAHADEPVAITGEGEMSLRFHVRGLIEDGTPLDPEAVVASAATLPHPVSPPNFGRSQNPAWGRVTVINRLNRHEWVLRYTLPTVEDVHIFVRPAGAGTFQQLHELDENSRLPFSGYRVATYLVSLHPDVPVEIVTRLHTRTPIGFPLTISSPATFFAIDREMVASAASLSVVPVVVLVYVVMLLGILRKNGLAALMAVLSAKLVYDGWVTGFGHMAFPFIPRHLWPTIGFTTVSCYCVASVLFLRRWLDLPSKSPRFSALLTAVAVVMVGLAVIEVMGFCNTRFLQQLLAPFMLLIFVVLSARAAWRSPSIGAICFALAWVCFLSDAILWLLRLVVLVPMSTHIQTYSQSAIAAALFGVAIFRRIKDQDLERNRSLSESNERFELAIAGSAAAIYEYNPNDRTPFYAPRLAELLGLPAQATLPRMLARASRPGRRQLLEALRKAMSGRLRQFRAELTHAVPGIPARHLAVTGAVQYGPAGELERICGSVIDITSEHALAVEQQLALALAREKNHAERSLVARTAFYAAANHDLRHPLLSLGLYLQMLAKESTLQKLDSFLPRMIEAHRSASDYVNRVLNLARADTGTAAQSLTLQPLQPVFSRLIDQYQADATHAGIRLRHVSTRMLAVTDAFLLDRILSNLLSNAIRNTRKGGVLIGCRRISGGLRIDVIDTGSGMPEGIRLRVMNGDIHGTPVPSSESMQLGLSIVHRSVKELGYRIDVATRLGKGTRFSIIIVQ